MEEDDDDDDDLYVPSRRVRLFVKLLSNLHFFDRFSKKNTQILSLMKICLAGAELSRADRQTE